MRFVSPGNTNYILIFRPRHLPGRKIVRYSGQNSDAIRCGVKDCNNWTMFAHQLLSPMRLINIFVALKSRRRLNKTKKHYVQRDTELQIFKQIKNIPLISHLPSSPYLSYLMVFVCKTVLTWEASFLPRIEVLCHPETIQKKKIPLHKKSLCINTNYYTYLKKTWKIYLLSV